MSINEIANIKVINAGMLTTVQDMGRYGLQASGMQVSGCMDIVSARLANALAGNETLTEGTQMPAVLETTYLGPELEFMADTVVAVTGGEPDVTLDGKQAAAYQSIAVKAGQRLKVAAQKKGMRAYIAVAGGIAVPKALGSRSTNLKLGLGGHQGRKLSANDELPLGEINAYAKKFLAGELGARKVPSKYLPNFAAECQKIRVILGPQEDYFSEAAIRSFTEEIYTVSPESDRMGYRLEGRPVEKIKQQDLITDGIVFGSIQIPPNGQPIIMLADHQTTGGYPKLATVATVDLPILAQAMPGTKLQFDLVTVQEAQALIRSREERLRGILAEIEQAAEKNTAPVLKPGAKAYNFVINGQSFAITISKA